MLGMHVSFYPTQNPAVLSIVHALTNHLNTAGLTIILPHWKLFAVTGLLSCLPWVLTLMFEACLKVVQRLGLLRLLPQEVPSLLPCR